MVGLFVHDNCKVVVPMTLLYVILFLTGVLGNLAVCLVIVRLLPLSLSLSLSGYCHGLCYCLCYCLYHVIAFVSSLSGYLSLFLSDIAIVTAICIKGALRRPMITMHPIPSHPIQPICSIEEDP